jgi:GTP cyclohydrolase I
MDKENLKNYLKKALRTIRDRFDNVSDIEETVNRLIKVWYEMSESFNTPPPKLRWFPTEFEGILIKGPIEYSFLCPHHLLPVFVKVYVGMVPNGYTLGISKITRTVFWACRKNFALQETITKRIADALWEEGGGKNKLRGIIVEIIGKHNCEEIRGIKCDSNVITIEKRGKINKRHLSIFIQFMQKFERV